MRPAAKGRVAKAPAAGPRRARSVPLASVDLIAGRPGSFPECRVELEGPFSRMRLTRKHKLVYSQAREDHNGNRGLINEEYRH